jgi:hypothetical protein
MCGVPCAAYLHVPKRHYIGHETLVETYEEVCVAKELYVDETVLFRVSRWSEEEV